MTTVRRRRGLAASISALALLGILALPVHGANVNIPEGGAVTPGSVFLINFQAQEGCDGLAMDTLEVFIPEEVDNPLPEDVPGWDVVMETESGEGDPNASDERISVVRWTGGPLEPGRFLEFGLRLGFPDEPGMTIEFPVVQRCGVEESASAPTVTLAPRFGPRDLIELSEQVAALQAENEELRSRLGDVDPSNLRSRVSDNESAIQDLQQRLDEMESDQG